MIRFIKKHSGEFIIASLILILCGMIALYIAVFNEPPLLIGM
jgi:hypothetical protein